jgi:histidinol-phosphate/aromatic aminotransferase/cobyric acid decarboxylase-like protein
MHTHIHAVILAAGIGRRMRPLTNDRPKTLLEVAGRSMIRWIVDAVLAHGIDDITVVTGYCDGQLRAHLAANYPGRTFRYVHNDRYDQTNNIYSLALALGERQLAGDLLLVESDLVFGADVLGRLLASPYPNAALVDHYRGGLDGTVITVEGGVITSVIPPHLQSAGFDFSDKYKTLNIYRFSRAFCETTFARLLRYYTEVIDDKCYYELILGILIYMRRVSVHAVILEGEPWAEIDDPNDLEVARYQFEPNQRRAILEQSHGGYWNYSALDFCYLRNMYFPSGAVLCELRSQFEALLHNYGSVQAILDRKLANHLLCDPTAVIALSGASQAFPVLAGWFDAAQVLRPEPSFGEYARAYPGAHTYADAPGRDGIALLAEVEARIAAGIALVLLVNPNNPSGTTLPTAAIHALAGRHPGTRFLVDESFIDFSNQPSLLPLLEATPLRNVSVLKSLSKTLGVPGLRLGYLYGRDAELNTRLRAALPIWNLNSLAEFYLEIIIKHRETLAESFVLSHRDRARFAEELVPVAGVAEVHAGGGNFVLARLAAADAAAVGGTLLQRHGLYVKTLGERFSDGGQWLRLAVRLPHENTRLAQCLEQAMK